MSFNRHRTLFNCTPEDRSHTTSSTPSPGATDTTRIEFAANAVRRVTLNKYVPIVPSAAVTATPTVFDPTLNANAEDAEPDATVSVNEPNPTSTDAPESLVVGVNRIWVTPLATDAVYDVVSASKSGSRSNDPEKSVPFELNSPVNPDSEASSDSAAAGFTVTATEAIDRVVGYFGSVLAVTAWVTVAVPSATPVTVTGCGVLQLEAVNVNAPDTVAAATVPLVGVMVTDAVG